MVQEFQSRRQKQVVRRDFDSMSNFAVVRALVSRNRLPLLIVSNVVTVCLLLLFIVL